jgi:hypothetical protein
MSDIKNIQNEYVTVKGPFGVINQGNGYAIVNVHTREEVARNISSFLDCVKTIDYLLGEYKNPSDSEGETTTPPDDLLDELDLATVRSIATYFEEYAPETILRYHQDHNATYEEAQVLCKRCKEIAGQLRQVRNKQDLSKSIHKIELLKQQVSRFQHREYQYRWTTHLERDVLAKLNPILSEIDSRLAGGDNESEGALRGLKPDIQKLIRKYAPETVKVKKDSNILGYSWYKCYSRDGNRLGTVRGSSGNRYWQYGGLDSQKQY